MTAAGEVIAGRYRLVASIGRGAMGEVWRAHDERLDRVVAVKLLRPDVVGEDLTEEEADRLGRREGRVAARVRHPHAIMVHDAVEHDGRPCLVMEYFPARSLSEILDADGPRPPADVAAIGGRIASALAAAHAEGVVHRDVKPGNVLVAADGNAKIADFGISRALGDGTMTGTGFIAGTPAYLAPEVARGEPASFASDVFSLGATLYTLQEGEPPFGHDDNPLALLQRVARGGINPPRTRGPVTDVLLWLLRENPAERPLMAEVHDAFTAIAEGRPAPWTAPPPPTPTLLLPRTRPPRRVVLLGVAATCLTASGVVVGLVINQGPSRGAAADPPGTTVVTTTATTPPDGSCRAEVIRTDGWPGGYQVEVRVRNDSGTEVLGWTVRLSLPPGHRINDLWNGTETQDGTEVTVLNEDYNAILKAGGSTNFGFNADASDDPGELNPTCASR